MSLFDLSEATIKRWGKRIRELEAQKAARQAGGRPAEEPPPDHKAKRKE